MNIFDTPYRISGAASFYSFPVVSAMNGIIMIGATVVILRTGVFWRWLGWSGVVIGIAAIGGSAALVENDPEGLFATISAFSWLVYFLWIAAASIGMIREHATQEMTGILANVS